MLIEIGRQLQSQVSLKKIEGRFRWLAYASRLPYENSIIRLMEGIEARFHIRYGFMPVYLLFGVVKAKIKQFNSLKLKTYWFIDRFLLSAWHLIF